MLDHLNQLFSCIMETNEPVIAGIDEAGRGPAIGPMVYGLYVAKEDEKTFYKDSKLLSPAQRENFFKNMRNYAYIKLNPIYITSYMESGVKNLNEIAKDAVIALLNNLKSKCSNVKRVYIDGLGNNVEYKNTLLKHFNYDFVIENKADSKYQVVSGASIVAKVTRDEEISKFNCGSGYPSDPNTQKWLKDNFNEFFGFSSFVRHSWSTVKTMLPTKKSRKLEKSLSGFYTNFN